MIDLIERKKIIDLIEADIQRNDLEKAVIDYLSYSMLYRVRALPRKSIDHNKSKEEVKTMEDNDNE